MPKQAIYDLEHVAAIGRRLRGRRQWLDMTQQQVGAALGITFQQVQKYESGVNDLSTLGLVRAATVLATTPHELLAWSGSASPAAEMTALLADPAIASVLQRMRAMDTPRRKLCHALVCQVDSQ